MKTNITMDMIAERAGVSKSTVSYALSGKKKLSTSVKKRVLETAEKLGYRPQTVASELFLDQAKRIRLAVDFSPMSNDSAICRHEIIRGVMDTLAGTNYELCIAPSSDNYSPINIDSLQGILSVFDKKTSAGGSYPNNIPTVYIGHPDKVEQPFIVDVDVLGAGYQAAVWALKQGVKKILFIKDTDWTDWYDQYEKGFLLACEEQGFPVDDVIKEIFVESSGDMMAQLDLQYGDGGSESYNDTNIDAIIVPSDTIARQLLSDPAYKDKNILSMKQFPHILLSEDSIPGTVFPAFEIGAAAAEMLMGVISKQRVVHNTVMLSCDFNEGTGIEE
jgi:LacI family transcriptional regulator, galactose operon repressor